MTGAAHATVLLREAVDALVWDENACYVDGTFGRGGHSAEILARLSARGQLFAIDKDPEACAWARQRFANDERFSIIHGSFADLPDLLATQQLPEAAGVLLDLGVSSPQLDDAERGFSFQHDGPLDMRMDPRRGQSAAQWLASAGEAEIARVLKEYGEEKFARRMARAIIKAREQAPITRTGQLAEIIKAANPAWEKSKHPATRAFQAIRIFINEELLDLQRLLDQVLELLVIGGRLVVISFHSLEDRLVKRFIRNQENPVVPRGLPLRDSEIQRRLRSVGRAVRAGAEEVAVNR
ncbi:MAG TPA: 16S rRNA (cytosine(1402)-N(4))-methyltransferase, partial [Porticoccaceae bacterium]|nr:16S rRNA (cytosine(1402)-N(4))-methyltransferase [Porticoccaceae bacterium]